MTRSHLRKTTEIGDSIVVERDRELSSAGCDRSTLIDESEVKTAGVLNQ